MLVCDSEFLVAAVNRDDDLVFGGCRGLFWRSSQGRVQCWAAKSPWRRCRPEIGVRTPPNWCLKNESGSCQLSTGRQVDIERLHPTVSFTMSTVHHLVTLHDTSYNIQRLLVLDAIRLLFVLPRSKAATREDRSGGSMSLTLHGVPTSFDHRVPTTEAK